MDETVIIPLAASAGFGLAVLFAVAALGAMRSPTRAARGRVAALAASASPYSAGDALLNRRKQRRFSSVTEFLAWSVNERTALQLARSGIPLRVGEWVAVRLLALAATAVLTAALGHALIGPEATAWSVIPGLLIGAALPGVFLRVAAKRRAEAVESQLVELCDLMASMLRSGYGYVQALTAASAELGAPLSRELEQLVNNVRLGGDVDEAFEELNQRLGSRDFDMIATAIAIQRRSGGNLSEILEGVARTVRQRQSFKRDLSAMTARERYSAAIVAGIPLLLVVILSAMDPTRYGLLFTDIRGQVILGIALAMDVAGYLVIKQISKVEV